MLYACDFHWWQEYALEVARTVKSELWSISTAAQRDYGCSVIGHSNGRGLSRQVNHIHTGQNSGYQAIGLAYLWGAKRILLLGYDFQFQGAKRHWHGDHPNTLGNCGGNMGRWIQSMGFLAEDLKNDGVEVVNCSRSTALRCFRQSTIDRELEGIK